MNETAARLLVAGALACGSALLVGCSSRPKVEPMPREAKVRADRFMHALIVDRDLEAAAQYSGGEKSELRDAQAFAIQDGIKSLGAGVVKRHCVDVGPYTPNYGQTETEDCIIYKASGIPPPCKGENARVTVTFTVSAVREDGIWKPGIDAVNSDRTVSCGAAPANEASQSK
jgi:outer membrane murein-binding lipoprotein Lpp